MVDCAITLKIGALAAGRTTLLRTLLNPAWLCSERRMTNFLSPHSNYDITPPPFIFYKAINSSSAMQDIEDAHNRFIFVEGNGSTARTRRHVMRDIGKQRRSKDRPWTSNVSRVRIPVQVKAAATANIFGVIDKDSEEDQWSHQGHITHLGNSRLDPFASYPIPMDRRSLELIWYSMFLSVYAKNLAEAVL